jgi:diguanylate cyclase (GGDEF)-like protein
MELKTYIRILFRHWWIILPAFLVTLTATIVFTFNQPSIYSSKATFVVSPSAAFQDVKSFATSLDTLSRRTEIANTYSELATSRTVRKAALDKLGIPMEQRGDLSITSSLLAGTNVLKITVESPDPAIARDVANAVGAELVEHTQTLYEPFVLRPLDEALLSKTPVSPSKKTNIILGAVFGLVLGGGLAFLVEYLRTPLESTSVHFIDKDIGIYNRSYFQQRLGAEMARAQRQNYFLSVALLDVDQAGVLKGMRSRQEQSEVLRKMTLILKQYLRQEDLIAYFGNATFALLLPDMPGETAKAMLEKLQLQVSWKPFELERSGTKISLSSVAGIAALDHAGMEQNDLVVKASRALHLAGTNGYDPTHLITEEAIDESI